jgi:hypothetical protein
MPEFTGLELISVLENLPLHRILGLIDNRRTDWKREAEISIIRPIQFLTMSTLPVPFPVDSIEENVNYVGLY